MVTFFAGPLLNMLPIAYPETNAKTPPLPAPLPTRYSLLHPRRTSADRGHGAPHPIQNERQNKRCRHDRSRRGSATVLAAQPPPEYLDSFPKTSFLIVKNT